MKNIYLYLAGAVVALFIVGCGKSSGGSSNSTVGVCASGLVNTQYGCLSQGNCPVGQAQYNNGQCVAATANQCGAGSNYSSQVGSCLPQANCPVGQGLYNGQCIIAEGYNTNINNGGFNNGGFNNGGFNAGFNYQTQYQTPGYNPYIPQQNYNNYYSNPFYNPCWTPQYYYGW